MLNDYRLSELFVNPSKILDCRDPQPMGLKMGDLIYDIDYGVTQTLGAAAFEEGYEGLLVPSATRLGDNLVLIPENMESVSRVEVISSRDPPLYVERT